MLLVVLLPSSVPALTALQRAQHRATLAPRFSLANRLSSLPTVACRVILASHRRAMPQGLRAGAQRTPHLTGLRPRLLRRSGLCCATHVDRSRCVSQSNGSSSSASTALAAAGRQHAYLLLFYNCGERDYSERNTYWLAVGVEDAATGEVFFSQPEILLFDVAGQGNGDNYTAELTDRTGYPDIVDDPAAEAAYCAGCTVFVTETNKTNARTHGIPPGFLVTFRLLSQDTLSSAATAGLVFSFNTSAKGSRYATPPLPAFSPSGGAFQDGFTVEFWLRGGWDENSSSSRVTPGQSLVDVRSLQSGAGFAVLVAEPLSRPSSLDAAASPSSRTGSSETVAALTLALACCKMTPARLPT
jgi:hypothetical protein